ncbi:MAG: hypothetical protein HC767_02995, partial [Akkermansiaceae bacterium]|nr:hypothetical protein [Akkermansiaceae bacterium]
MISFVDAELHLAAQGALPLPVPLLLQRIGKIYKQHPSVKAAVQQRRRVRAIWKLLHEQCKCSSVYDNELSISQLASAQASLGLYCEEFWAQLARRKFVFQHYLPAVTCVHAYASLRDCRLAPAAAEQLEHVLLTAVEQNIEHQNALGFSNACWSLVKLKLAGLGSPVATHAAVWLHVCARDQTT